MKIPFAAARVAVIAAVFLGLFVSIASAGSKPIPGVDIIVQKKPGGIAMHATTDNAGKFVFDNLDAGQYALSVKPKPPQTKAIVSTTRSNIKHQGMKVENGVQVVTASVQLGADAASAEIEITAAKGKIIGTVTSAAPAAQEKPAKAPAQGTPKKAGKGKGAK